MRILELADEAIKQLQILKELIDANGKWLEENCEKIVKE